MKPLPLPDFDSAISRLKYWIEPLLDEDSKARSYAAIDAFVQQEGMALYQELAEKTQEISPKSWLLALWQEQFLTEQESLPLTGSNLTMKVDWHAPQHGLKRIAHFAITMAHIHKRYEENPQTFAEILQIAETEKSCQAQFSILRGACRRPKETRDELIIRNPEDNAKSARHIIVMYRGHGWKIQIMDEKGGIATPAQLENVLYELVQTTTENNDIPFAAPSILPHDIAIEIYKQLLCRDENNRIMQSINQAWFVLSLDSTHYNDDAEAFFAAAFGQGDGFWAYKPINYLYHLKDDRIFLHFDRVSLDPVAAKEMLDAGQALFAQGPFPRKNQLPDNLNLSAINWTIDGRKINENSQQSRIDEMDGSFKVIYEALGDYQRRTEQMMVTVYDVFMTDDERRLLNDYADTAVIQILLQYAQLEVYGKVKNTCEIIDMRRYFEGRTDVIPSVTADTLALVQALHENEADVGLLRAANNAHLKRQKLTQSGGGIYGLWLALHSLAEQKNLTLPIFSDKGLSALSKPFVVTLESGAPRGAGHIVFPPPDKQGLSVSYASGRNYFNFVFTHQRNKVNEVEKFTRAIGSGLKKILLMLREDAS